MAFSTLKRVNTVGIRYISGEVKEEHFEAIIEGILQIPEEEVFGIDERYKKILIKVDNEDRYRAICENFTDMQMNVEPGVVIEVNDISSYRTRVVAKDVPFEIDDEKLNKILSKFGHVEKIYNQNNYKLKQSKYSKVRTGKRIIWMDIDSPIPSSLCIKQTDVYISFSYDAQERTCYNCGLIGHGRRYCETDEQDKVNVVNLEDLMSDSDDDDESDDDDNCDDDDKSDKENNNEKDDSSIRDSTSDIVPHSSLSAEIQRIRSNLSAEIHLDPTQEAKQYECHKCNYKCSYENILKDHMETHTEEIYFLCSECKINCKSQEELTNHLSTHIKEKMFNCTECDLSFISNELLEKHLLTHTAEKPFKCNKCEYKFDHEGELKMHMQNHTEERVIDDSVAEWVNRTSFAEVIRSPPKHMASTPKSQQSNKPVISASQPCKPISMEISSAKSKRCMSSSPEIAPKKNKYAKNYTVESSNIKKPSNKSAKQSKNRVSNNLTPA